ncbi:MAG: PAS domain-containing protein [Actinomycetia bacterium]|nr:PAS domain-containing protein [Actinomycetes bacterium]
MSSTVFGVSVGLGLLAVVAAATLFVQWRRAAIQLSRYRDRSELLDLVLDVTPTTFTLRDVAGRFLYVNKAYADLIQSLGVDPAGLLGHSLDELMEVTGQGTLIEDVIGEVATTGKGVLAREFTSARIADDRTFLLSVVPVGDDHGGVTSVVTMNTEITYLKQVESALRDSEALLRLLIDSLPVTVTYRDESRRFQIVNEAMAKRYALSAQDLIGRTVTEITDHEDPELVPRYEAVLEGQTQAFEIDIENAEGRREDHEIHFVPHFDDNGEVVGFFSLGIDITGRLQLEQQLRHGQKMEAVGQMTGGVAHDFNNLLSVVLGNAELLAGQGSEADPRVNEIMKAAHRGAELTKQLLTFSRKQPLQPQPIDLAELASSMSTLLTSTVGKTIDVQLELAADLWPCRADPGQLENALLNLALNARDAMPAGGRLTITGSNRTVGDSTDGPLQPGDFVELSVDDDGTGMSPETRDRAFEPFFTTKEFGRGSGMGLAMVYGFASQSHGEVTIASKPDGGTTVSLLLPRSLVAPAPRGAHDGSEAASSPGHGKTVLVIEDSPEVRSLVLMILADRGYTVLEAADAKAARQILDSSDDLDVVLSDVVLPGGESGPRLARSITATRPELKFVFMSGYADMDGGLQASDGDLLQKPFDQEQLARAIHDALAR